MERAFSALASPVRLPSPLGWAGMMGAFGAGSFACVAAMTQCTRPTVAGGAGFAGPEQPGTAVRFNAFAGIALDSSDNIYVADFYFSTIRKGYPPPKLFNLSFVPGQFRFDLTAPPGQSVVVEASTDLRS